MPSPLHWRTWLLAGATTLIGVLAVLVLLRGPWQHHPADPEAPRTPKDSAGAFRQEEVRFHSGDNTLAGVLVLPATPGPHPVVMFLSGSGATDRSNRGLFPPLWAHFARHGFASFAWDRPGVGQSSGDFETQTFRDRAEEALAAVRLLRGRADIRRDAVGLWGFSQGAAVAPLAAALSGDLAFVIAVSGSQVPAWQQDPYRVEAELRADGFAEADVAEATAFAWKRMDLIRRARPFEELDRAQKQVRDRRWFGHVHDCDRKRFESGIITVGYDPGPHWEQVRCPVLAIFGDKDASCPVERSAAAVRGRLARAGNRDVTIKVFPRADHPITVSDTGGPKEAARRRAREGAAVPAFAPGYLETMSGWLAERFGPRR